MEKNNNIVGKKFGRLIALSLSGSVDCGRSGKCELWLCKCDCGNKTIVRKWDLGKNTKSCGCLQNETRKSCHPKKSVDITGNRYGRLTAIKINHIKIFKSGSKGEYWLCKCDCGNEKIILKNSLGKRSNSCGCLLREKNGERMKTHGESKTRLYGIWEAIKQRLYNKNHNSYINYGGRGISICNEWKSFNTFKEWALKNGYNNNLSIDRIDVNGNYDPANCRWVTLQEQANNTRRNVNIEYRGVTMTASQWSNAVGGNNGLVAKRIRRGWSEERAVNTPIGKGDF
jgi:hypothetical protein